MNIETYGVASQDELRPYILDNGFDDLELVGPGPFSFLRRPRILNLQLGSRAGISRRRSEHR